MWALFHVGEALEEGLETSKHGQSLQAVVSVVYCNDYNYTHAHFIVGMHDCVAI